MKFTLSWLKQFLDTDATLEEITHTLTMTGLEVEEVIDHSAALSDFKVAQIIHTTQHPNADKLKLCTVQTQTEELQIVCGAPNAREGIKVALATVGTLIPNGHFKIKKSSIRGVESCGMLCSADELDIGKDSDGIIELPDHAIIGDQIAKYLGLNDPMIHINITPNRADALGVYGIARDLSASGIGTLKPIEIPSIQEGFKTHITLTNNNIEACPLFAAREIKDLNNNLTSPSWLKYLLNNIGMESISPLVDVTNYISYSFGQPMHAYDADKITNQLIVEPLTSGPCSFNALNDTEYQLQNNDLVIRDQEQIHCLAGIIGGINSACNNKTTKVVLEAANFDSNYITSTGRRLIIDTDSRYRFERNVDRAFAKNALDLATHLILSICGGIASNRVDTGSEESSTRAITFPIECLKSKTNIDLSSIQISDILTKLGFKCDIDTCVINIIIPSWRYDITIPEDIVEEIIRIYGYDKIPEVILPNNKQILISDTQRRVSDIKRLLASNGYVETVTYSFIDSKKATLFTDIIASLTLQNPISSDMDYMRPSIIPNLLQSVCNNSNRSFTDLSLFEVGPVFFNSTDDAIRHASGIRTGLNNSKNHHEKSRIFDVFDIKADIALILNHIGLDINKCQIRTQIPDYYHPTRSAAIFLGKNLLGYFGEIHPTILKAYDISNDVMAFELNITALPVTKAKYGKKPIFTISNYQMITRDYAFVIDRSQPVGEILSLIKNLDKKLIKSVQLFDIFNGQNIEDGKKSIGLTVEIQDNNKTLIESEINLLHNKIINKVQSTFNAILRSA